MILQMAVHWLLIVASFEQGIINDVSDVILSLIALTEDEICDICPQLSEEWGFLL